MAERDDDRITLTAFLRLEFCRPGLDYDRRMDGEALEFRLRPGDLERFAGELEVQSAAFPQRPAAR